MALLTDNSDFSTVYFRIITGNDGDYYPQIISEDENGNLNTAGIRVCMSGGNAPTDVKLAIANLYRALEKHHLNEYPNDAP